MEIKIPAKIPNLKDLAKLKGERKTKVYNPLSSREFDTVVEDHVDLIIKPLVSCNFKCSFCSSTYLSENHKDRLSIEQLDRFFAHFPNTRTVVVNGGEPLLMNPKYYFDILEIFEKRNMKHANISITSNLYPFYTNPDKWVPLLTHEKVDMVTSFQYGEGRIKHDLTPYSEEDFWRVSDLFLEKIGYRPDFISVTTKENAKYVLKTVELAKKMDIQCKVNYLNASGKKANFKGIVMGSEDEMFTISDMYEKYIEIFENGLAQWEFNTQQMIKRVRKRETTCPLFRSCGKSIRTLNPDGSYYSCGDFSDDGKYPIDFEKEMRSKRNLDPISDRFELLSMHEGCFTCPVFEICNGCRKTISDTKRLGLVESHCAKMKTLIPKILEISNNDYNLEATA